jgi:hypothetical protein
LRPAINTTWSWHLPESACSIIDDFFRFIKIAASVQLLSQQFFYALYPAKCSGKLFRCLVSGGKFRENFYLADVQFPVKKYDYKNRENSSLKWNERR